MESSRIPKHWCKLVFWVCKRLQSSFETPGRVDKIPRNHILYGVLLATNTKCIRTIEFSLNALTTRPAVCCRSASILNLREVLLWLAADNHGNDIMHVLARDDKLHALEWLVTMPFARSSQHMRDVEGETPLEIEESRFEESRVKG